MVVRPFMFWSRPLEGTPERRSREGTTYRTFGPNSNGHTIRNRTSRVGVTDFEGVGSARAQYTETIAELGIC